MIYETDEWRHSNIGRLLNNAVTRFESRVMELMTQSGHPQTRPSHLGLTRNLDAEGTRVTDLARRARISKQAMGELVDQCQLLGLVTRVADPADARAKIVAFTPLGTAWLAAFKDALQQTETEMRAELGTLRVDGLSSALTDYAGAYGPLNRS